MVMREQSPKSVTDFLRNLNQCANDTPLSPPSRPVSCRVSVRLLWILVVACSTLTPNYDSLLWFHADFFYEALPCLQTFSSLIHTRQHVHVYILPCISIPWSIKHTRPKTLYPVTNYIKRIPLSNLIIMSRTQWNFSKILWLV